MTQSDTWTAVDAFVADRMHLTNPPLANARRHASAEGLPSIEVSEAHGRLLSMLVAMSGARRVLEIGTLGGYSAIQMAQALPEDGKLITLEFDPHHAQVAAASIAGAGLAERVEIRVGPALQTLAELVADKTEPFDFAFIDADKANNKAYIARSLELCRSGAVIICDNVVRDGSIVDRSNTDAGTVGAREAITEMGRAAPQWSTVVQTVGVKGYDGFAIMIAP